MTTIENLRKYQQISYYGVKDIQEKLIELSDLECSEELSKDLKNALYQLQAIALNEYNSDFYRTLYNVLLVICGFDFEE